MLSRSHTSNDEGAFGATDGAGDADSVPLAGDGDADGDGDGDTGTLGGGVEEVAEGDADGDPDFGADGEGEAAGWAGREDQLTPIA